MLYINTNKSESLIILILVNMVVASIFCYYNIIIKFNLNYDILCHFSIREEKIRCHLKNK